MRLKLTPEDQQALIAKFRATGRYDGRSDRDILAAAGRRDYRQHELGIGDVRKATWGDLLGARSTHALGEVQDAPLGVPAGPGVPQPPMAAPAGPAPALAATGQAMMPEAAIPVPPKSLDVAGAVPTSAVAKALRRRGRTRYSG